MKLSNTKALTTRLLVGLALAAASVASLYGSAEAATCYTCHAPVGSTTDMRPVESTYRNITTGSIKGSHLKHIPSATTQVSACTPCHGGAAGYSTNHSLLAGNLIQLPGVGYSKTASFPQDGNPVLGTCSAASCHASAYGTGFVTSPTWGVGSNCLGCHSGVGAFTGIGSSPNTGSHSKHLAKSAVCGDCHAGAVVNANGGSSHIDGNIDIIGGYPANVSKHAQGTYTGTCNSATCHVSPYGTSLVTSTVWGIADCAACHTGTGAFTGTGSSPNTGSHNKHLTTSATCATCHLGALPGATGSGGNSHINSKIEVTGVGYNNANITKHASSSGYSTCSSASCHVSPYGTAPAVSPTWGLSAGCVSCHTAAGAFTGTGLSPNTGSHTKHMAVVLPAPLGATTCGSCHAGAIAGTTGGSGHADTHIDVVGYVTASVTKHAPGSGYNSCNTSVCHVSPYGTASISSPTWGVVVACGECHTGIGAFTAAGSSPITGSHTKHMGVVVNAVQTTCGTCHSGATAALSGGDAHIDGNIDVIGYKNLNVTKHTANSGFTTCTTANCHVSPYGTAPISSPTWGTVIVCGECHTGIGAFTGLGSAPITGSHTKHMSLVVNAVQTNCGTCHAGAAAGTSGGIAHLDGNIDVIGYSTANVVKHAANTSFTTCTTAACHVSPYAATSIPSPVWGVVAPCGECHTGVGAFTGTGSSPTTGSHVKHQAIPATCDQCHTGASAGISGGTAHIDGDIDVVNGYTPNVVKHAAGSGYGICNNASCHTDPYDTTPAFTPTWGVTGPGCANCHIGVGAFTGAGTSPTTGSHSKHQAAAVACATCHTGVIAGVTGGPSTVHRDSNIDVSVGGYPSNITKHVSGSGYSTCSNETACHVSAYNAASVGSPTWGAGVAPCVACHTGVGAFTGAGSSPNTGSHTKHMAFSPLCANCHLGTVAGVNGGPTTVHRDGNVDVITGYSYQANVPKHAAGTYTSLNRCNNTVCHIDVYGTVSVISPTWGQASGCAACHNGTGAFTGLGSAPVTGSHTKHIKVNPLCSTCHTGATSGVTGGTAHIDGNIDVIGGYPGNVTKHAINIGFTCNNTACHVTPYGTSTLVSPSWGAASAGCVICHNGVGAFTGPVSYPTTGSHTKHQYAGAVCNDCHAGASAGVSGGINHLDGNVDVLGYLTANVVKHSAGAGYTSCNASSCHANPYGTTSINSPVWGSGAGGCVSCHTTVGAFTGTGSTPATGRHTMHFAVTLAKSATCQSCHDGAIAGVSGGTSHNDGNVDVTNVGYTPNVTKHAAGAYTGTCNVSCHGSALTSNTTTGYPGTPSGNLTLPAWNTPFLNGLPSTVGNGSTTFGVGDCAKCHGFPPMTSTHAGKLATECNGCHPNVGLQGTSFLTPATHVDGTVQSTSSCTSCHAKVNVARVNVMQQFTTASNSHHYQGNTSINNVVCYACHWEADSLGATTSYHGKSGTAVVDLVIWSTTGVRPTSWSTTGTPTATTYLSGGAVASSRAELTKINSHCLGCHNDANKNIQPFTAADTHTPSSYSWEGKSTALGGFGAVQSIASKYASTTTTAWGKFTGNYTNTKNQVKAYSAHNNTANQRGWSTLLENPQGSAVVSNYPNTSGTVAVLCFDCHNSHGSAANTPTAITSSYDSATGVKKGAILKQTITGFGGYAVTYTPGAAGSSAEKNLHNAGAGICFDCHNNSAVSAATISGSTTPWGYTATFGASQAIHGYNDTPYFGKSGGVFAKNVSYPYTALTGTQGAMNLNKGGHFGVSSTLNSTPANQIGGLCTPCHDPHGVSPGLAANQAYAVPLLKGTFVTSPYKIDAAAPAIVRGGGSKQPVLTGSFVAGYHIDQNTMPAGTAGKSTTTPGAAVKWAFATSAKTLQTLNSSQFGGLCDKCHTQASLNNTAAVTTANWKTSPRIHNAVAGWAMTSGTGLNANNKVHAYTCSKCHTTHNSRLPRLLVTNCLDVKHAGRVLTQAALPYLTSPATSSSQGLGRFPGGGGGAVVNSTATNPGPWYFGVTAGKTTPKGQTQTCHDTATAGGTVFDATSQQWNTKSLW